MEPNGRILWKAGAVCLLIVAIGQAVWADAPGLVFFQGVLTDIISADKKNNLRPIRIFRTRAYGVDKSEGENHHERRYQERTQYHFSIHVVHLPIPCEKPLESIS